MKKLFMTGERDCIYDEVAKNDLIANVIYKEEDFYEVDKDGYPIEAMREKTLKEKVIDGDIAILKVVDMKGKLLRIETIDWWGLLDLLIEPNSERMADLLTLYDGQEIVHADERYSILCGVRLIAELIEETAANILEAVKDSEYIDEEKFAEYEERYGVEVE